MQTEHSLLEQGIPVSKSSQKPNDDKSKSIIKMSQEEETAMK